MNFLKWYNINHAQALASGLRGDELLIFSALQALTADGRAWEGTAGKLDHWALTGKSADTISRIVNKLAQKGLIILSKINGKGMTINLPQNKEVPPQNSPAPPQNSAGFKESTKEKNNNRIKGERDISRTPTLTRTFEWDKPASPEECWEYTKAKHGLKKTYLKFWRHYEGKGWFGIRNWRAILLNWIEEDNEKAEKEAAREIQRQQLLNPNYR